MTPEFESKFIALAVAAIVAAVQMAVEHAVPWEKLFGRKVGPPWTYAAGVASLGLPFSALMALWRDWWAFWAFWTLFVFGGFSVFLGYHIRMIFEKESLYADLNRALLLASDFLRGRGGDDGPVA